MGRIGIKYNCFGISYSPSGRILNYSLTGSKLEDGQLSTMNLSRRYSYANTTKPHAPSSVRPTSNNNLIGSQSYQWDANGNYCGSSNPRLPSSRRAYSNEENRLSAIYDDDGIMTSHPLGMQGTGAGAAYLYSADGERVWKFAGTATMTYSNGLLVNSDLEMDKTFYPTSQTTLDKRFFYKHYYVGGERICTSMGQFYMTAANTPPHVGFVNPNTTAGSFIAAFTQTVSHALDSVGYSGYIAIDPDFNCITTSPYFRTKTYYYHYNHQGSVSLVTYQNGTLQQHLQYLPYGGIFVDHRPNSYASTYTFSAKEKDSESGYTYFGARYYSDNMMQWLSVDPMSDERPWISPYNYCQWNPIGRVDTWGMLDDEWEVNSEPTRYRNTKGELLYETQDGLDVDIIVPDGGISQLKKELQTAKNNGTINDSETNEQKMHVLGVSPDEYSQAATRGMDDYWSLGYRETYEEAYKEGLSQFSLGQIFSGVISLFSSLSGDNSGEMRHGGRSAGILEGNNDREKGNINRLNPVSCFKNNLPLIKLNNYKNDKAIFNYPGIGLPPR